MTSVLIGIVARIQWYPSEHHYQTILLYPQCSYSFIAAVDIVNQRL